MTRWEKFLVFFESGGCKVSPRFHVFVFDVNQQRNKGAGWIQHYVAWPRGWKYFLCI